MKQAFTRRDFLRTSGAAMTAFALPWLPRSASGAEGNPVLVVLYQRGAADGLNLVVPAGDPNYYALRPDIQVPPGMELPLDAFYGLHPQLGALLPLYTDGELVIVHAAGSQDGTRSHFDAQDNMERAAPASSTFEDGWLNRYLASVGATNSWTGVSLGAASVLALTGEIPSLAVTSLADFTLSASARQRSTLEAMYGAPSHPDLERAGVEAFEALDVIGAVSTQSAVVYPPGPVGAALKDAAALVRADIGVRVVAIDSGGWDHHESENDEMANVAPGLAGAIAAFRDDLAMDWGRTCLLVMTEFGRTAAQNGSQGTDHGHGSVMFAAGGGVAGGRVVTKNDVWPGLASGDLFEGRDLAVTTDFHDVFAEVLTRHLGVSMSSLDTILPSHTASIANFPGLFA